MSRRIIAALFSLLIGGAAQAAEGDGLSVGLWTAGGELAGTLAGGAVGLSLGAAACDVSDSFECYLPIVTTPVGATIGAFGGSTVAGTLSARGSGLDARRVRRWTLAAGATGAGVSVLGGLVGSSGLVATGGAISLVGMPVAAGLAARNAEPRVAELSRAPRLAIHPSVGPQHVALSVSGAF